MTIEEWANDFKSYLGALDIQRDDYNGIMEHIDDAIALLRNQENADKNVVDNYFRYSREDINKLIEQNKENGMMKVAMIGIDHNLRELKPVIEDIYKKYIFFLSYWENECPYFGWDWSKDDGTLRSMAKITDGITDKLVEIYALILTGLGEKMNDKDSQANGH